MLGARFETVREDAVQCFIFIEPQLDHTDILAQVQATVSAITKNYLWHKDSFNVHLPIAPDEGLPHHIYSSTCFGDNIEDEWFIVYILMELTKIYLGLVAQVRDNDGEFLLIEAAEALPAWVTPDTTENRVFITNGELHLITPNLIDIKKSISIKEALGCINKNLQMTRAADNIQMIIKKRLQGYPQRIEENLHRAFVKLPVKFASVLQLDPRLVAQAVDAYCNRDILESKICKKMEMENCVDTCVTFTKCLYAKLIHSNEFHKASWKLPPKSSKYYKKAILGIKLACGFEILMSKASEDTFASKQWHMFYESLKKNAYFKKNIEGSKEYTKLLDAAKEYFIVNECSNINTHIGNNIKEIMSTTQFEEICHTMTHVTQKTAKEDSDEWLNINPKEMDDFMSQRYGKTNMFSKGGVVSPHTITNQLSSFLKQDSDLEGIEIDTEEVNSSLGDEHCINIDSNQFGDCVKNILDSLEQQTESDLDLDNEDSNCSSDVDSTEDKQAQCYQRAMDAELSTSTLAQSFVNNGKSIDLTKNAYVNFFQSMKEEQGSSGPSSNLLFNIGLNKKSTQLLDSDDEDMDG